jgi:hypothetical protein
LYLLPDAPATCCVVWQRWRPRRLSLGHSPQARDTRKRTRNSTSARLTVFRGNAPSKPSLSRRPAGTVLDTWGHSSVCKKLYAQARNYEGNWSYIRTDWIDAGQVLDLIKAVPEAAPQKLRPELKAPLVTRVFSPGALSSRRRDCKSRNLQCRHDELQDTMRYMSAHCIA